MQKQILSDFLFTFTVTPTLHGYSSNSKSSLCPQVKEPASQSKSLTDSDSSDDNEVNPRFQTSVEERQYNTIPGSATATHIALSYSRAQVNPTVERGAPQPHWKVKLTNL